MSTTELLNTESPGAAGQELLSIAEAAAIGRCSDQLVERAQNLYDSYKALFPTEKSPLRNVLAVATSPTASPKVVNNFILYQLGRASANKLWVVKVGNTTFAEALVAELSNLTDIKQKMTELIVSTAGCRPGEQQSFQIDMKLIQLFLGYLARYHTAMTSR